MQNDKLLPCYSRDYPKLYQVWNAMKKRCYNKNNSNYRLYGGRGITVCDEWMVSSNFCKWALDNGYKEGLELDRVDVDGNYEPSNCRWVDRKTNAQNQRRAIFITVDNETYCVSEWERRLGLGKGIIVSWIKRWGMEFATQRIKEVIETGTYTKCRKGQVQKLLRKGGVDNATD